MELELTDYDPAIHSFGYLCQLRMKIAIEINILVHKTLKTQIHVCLFTFNYRLKKLKIFVNVSQQ